MVGKEITSNAISCLHSLHQKVKGLSLGAHTCRYMDPRRVVLSYRPECGANVQWLASFRLKISGDFGVRFIRLVPMLSPDADPKDITTH